MASIQLDELSFRYPGAVEDTLAPLSLSVEDGAAFSLLGASGAGKTTLLNLLSGLLAPTSGRIFFDAHDVSMLAGRQRNVAQVFQFPVLYESMSVSENLAFPLRARKFEPVWIRQRVERIAAELGITQQLPLVAAQLSLFQKQLVAIGRALVRPDVSVVLLDEPLTAVEPRMKWRLRQTLRRVQKELGVTMIYVTHDQTEALTFAEQVAVMADGGLLQVGTPEQIYTTPSHEFVGYFIGSPGMNFVAVEHLVQPLELFSNTCRIGFRPEWAVLCGGEDGQLRGVVRSMQLAGTQGGIATGVVRIDTTAGEIAVRGRLDVSVGQSVGVHLQRHLCYSAQGRLLMAHDE